MRLGLRTVIAIALFGGFFALFWYAGSRSLLRQILQNTYKYMDQARRNSLKHRRRLLLLSKEKGGWYGRIERMLIYSGLYQRIPFMGVELWLAIQGAVAGLCMLAGAILGGGPAYGFLGVALWLALGRLAEVWMCARQFARVNEDLLKFLDFLGNYSLTSGEITGIFHQIGKYMQEPLRSALNACYYEAATSGDASLALLALAEKIEHPKFKDLIRNLEISSRYAADFKELVRHSRRDLRDYLRGRQERRGLYGEALAQMAILFAMALVIIAATANLTGLDFWQVAWGSLPGKGGTVALLCIALMMLGDLYKL